MRTIGGDGHILACFLPVASVQIYEAVPRASDPSRQEYDAAWERAEALGERVLAYLAGHGCAARGAGIIDMGDVRPLRATWRSDPEAAPARANGSGSVSGRQ